MADVNPPQPDVAPDTLPADKPSFLATPTGRLVVGGVAACILLGLLAFVAAAFLGARLQSPVKTVNVGVTTSTPTGGSTVATTTVPIAEPQERPLSSTFTFRNIFAPTVKPPKAASSSSGSGTSASTTTSVTVPADTLYLQSIETVNGEKTATLIWNGATYAATAGDTLGDTPWKVLEVNSDSVLMLYGDTQVTLTTGEILTK